MLDQLKNLELQRMDIDEAIALSAFARLLKAEYEHVDTEAPQWLDDRTREIRDEVRDRLRDTVQKRLRELYARAEALATAEEKRAKIREQIKKLESASGAGSKAT